MTDYPDDVVTEFSIDTPFSLKSKRSMKKGNFDSMIIGLPGSYDHTDANKVGMKLTQLSNAGCQAMGRKLHSAEFEMTRDPERVKELASICVCTRCSAALDQTLATMRDQPDMNVIAGAIYYLP